MDVYYPGAIGIETFRGCNARCIMCPVENYTPPLGQMEENVFSTIVTQLTEFREKLRSTALFFNGEPLMDKLLENRIAQCKDAGLPNIGFATNGSLLTEDRIRSIIDASPDWITVSFDSLDKETYESIKLRLDFNEVLQNILNLIEERNRQKSKTRLVLRFIEQEKNQGQFNSYFSFWAPKLNPDIDELHLNREHNWSRGSDGFYGNSPCGFIFGRYFIIRDGTLVLCPADCNAEHNFGNIMETSLLDIINSPQRETIRRLHRENKRSTLKLCSTCNIPELNKDGVLSNKVTPGGKLFSTDGLTPFDYGKARTNPKNISSS